GYWAPNHAADPAEQSKEEMHEAVFSVDETRDIPVDVTTDFFKTGDLTAQLTVTSRLDLHTVKFRAAEGSTSLRTLPASTGPWRFQPQRMLSPESTCSASLRPATGALRRASATSSRPVQRCITKRISAFRPASTRSRSLLAQVSPKHRWQSLRGIRANSRSG